MTSYSIDIVYMCRIDTVKGEVWRVGGGEVR